MPLREADIAPERYEIRETRDERREKRGRSVFLVILFFRLHSVFFHFSVAPFLIIRFRFDFLVTDGFFILEVPLKKKPGND